MTNNWVLNYLKLRQLNRFLQNVELFSTRTNLPNLAVFKKINILLKYNIGVNILTCSKKFFTNLPKNNYFTLYAPNNTYNFALTTDNLNVNKFSILGSSVIICNKNLYPLDVEINFYKNIPLPKQWVVENTTAKTATIRKILTQLTLKNLFLL